MNDCPALASETGDTIRLFYVSAFVKTVIIIEIQDGLLEVKSDNLTSITIIKDHISSEASNQKVNFNLESNMSEEESVLHCLKLIHPIVQE